LAKQYFRNMFHSVIIESQSGLRGGTTFDFKYVPKLGSITGKEDKERSGTAAKKLSRPAERILLLFFLVGCGALILTGFGVVKIGLLL
jgi:hypothetical protein